MYSQNLFLARSAARDMVVKILDFGVSKRVRGMLGQSTGDDDLVEPRWKLGHQAAHRLRLMMADPVERVDRRIGGERRDPGEALIEDRAQGKPRSPMCSTPRGTGPGAP